MEYASNVGHNKIEIIEDYDSFEKNIVESKAGRIDKDLSFAMIGMNRVFLIDIQLWRKANHDEEMRDYPKDDYSWWKGDGLYFDKKNIFPGARLSIYVKYFKLKTDPHFHHNGL